MRILLVEDDIKMGAFIKKGLEQAGYAVDHAEEGETGLHLALYEPFDAIIVDIMLPKVDGLSIIDTLRRNKVNTPVLILSAKRSVEDRVRGLQTGSDDYLTKPFSFSELLARVQALIRRSGTTPDAVSLRCKDLEMDLLSRKVIRSGKEIELQPREFALLEYLLRNKGRVISKTMILDHIWNYQFDPQTNVVDVLVSRLRSKVDRDFPDKILHTIRGAGYVLKETP